MGGAVGGQAFEQTSAGTRMILHNGSDATGADRIERKLPSAAGVPVRFLVEHRAAQGFTFTLSDGTRSYVQAWGSFVNGGATPNSGSGAMGQFASPGPGQPAGSSGLGGPAVDQRRTSINGRGPNDVAFNALEIRAYAETDHAGLTFSDLSFDTFGELGTRTGSLSTASSVDYGGRFIDGRTVDQTDNTANSLWQTIVSDTDLSAIDWRFSGLITLRGGPGAKMRFELLENNASFSETSPVSAPLPPGAFAGMTVMAGIAGIRLIRRRGHLD